MTSAFNPVPYLKKLNGKDYLEVVHRLQWLRAEHPDAVISTSLLHLDFEAGWGVFHARVEVPGQGIAEGTGSETRQAFPAGWLEKAETIAIGRALAALGYGTSCALEYEEGHPADSPVEPRRSPTAPVTATSSTTSSTGLATPAQLKLIYLTAARDAHLSEQELEEECQEHYGRLPLNLTKREASAFIDALKSRAK